MTIFRCNYYQNQSTFNPENFSGGQNVNKITMQHTKYGQFYERYICQFLKQWYLPAKSVESNLGDS